MLHLHVTVQHIQPQIIPIIDFQDKRLKVYSTNYEHDLSCLLHGQNCDQFFNA